MALPELLMPPTLPDFKAGGHKAKPEPLYGAVDRQGGASRKRRLFTSTPRRLEAQLEVTQAQLESFVLWHEEVLKAGSLPFAAKVAKVGPGVEYWEAYCLSFKVDHQEGSTHLLSLDLRLKGLPYATLPAASSLGVEFSLPLVFEVTGGYAYGLSAEFTAGLETLINEGAALSAQFLCRLDVECSGAVANPSLLAEFEASLEYYGIAGSSAELAAEFAAGLEIEILPVAQLTAEITTGLDFAVAVSGTLGYVNPAAISVLADFAPFKTNVTAILRLLPDGSVYTKMHTAAYVLEDQFYSPITPSVAAGKWVKAVLVAGDDSTLSPVAGVARQFNTTDALNWTLTASWIGAPNYEAVTLTILIANDPDFLDVISTFTADLAAEHLG